MSLIIFEIHTEEEITKTELRVLGASIKNMTDALLLNRVHLGCHMICPYCGYRLEVNPMKSKKKWICRHCGETVLGEGWGEG